jgi:hypothetical protein
LHSNYIRVVVIQGFDGALQFLGIASQLANLQRAASPALTASRRMSRAPSTWSNA